MDFKMLCNMKLDQGAKKGQLQKKPIIEMYFEMMHQLLYDFTPSNNHISFECIIELCQLLSFSFHSKMSEIWKLGEAYHNFTHFFEYFLLANCFRGNFIYFSIAFSVCILVITITQGLKILMVLRISRNSPIPICIVRTTKIFTQAITFLFFLPIIKILLGGFEYEDNKNVYQIDDKTSLYVFRTIGIIYVLILTLLSVYSKLTLFHTSYNKIDQGAKHTSSYERLILFTKLALLILFHFQLPPWVLGTLTFLISTALMNFYYVTQPDYSPFLKKIKLICAILFFWSGMILIIGLIFNISIFDGCMPLLIIGSIIFIITTIINRERYSYILYQNISSFKNPTDVFNHIRNFMNLISEKYQRRNTKIIISGYIEKYEQSESNNYSPLRKYKEAFFEKKYLSNSYLYQHVESLYQTAIAKFPEYIDLRIGYAIMLNEFLNKKQSALKEIINAKRYHPSFEKCFIIYKYEHEFTDWNYQTNILNSDNDNFSALAYKTTFSSYKNSLLHISLLYVEFWSLLINRNEDQEQLNKLYQIGNKISKGIEDINFLFEKLQKINMNEEEVLFYYIEFCDSILNDEEKAIKFKKRYDFIQDEKEVNEDVTLTNFSIKAITTTDKFKFILLSSKQGLFCIVNISLSICILLGYTKEELIGKPLDILIPELLQKEHRKILSYHYRKYNEDSEHKDIIKENNSKKVLKEVDVFALNKTKYLVPFHINSAIIPTENQGNLFIGQITTMQFNYNSYINKENNICYIFTNNNFIIQNFTTNAMNLLSLKSTVLNGKAELTSYIKQVHEDFLCQAVVTEDITSEQKIAIKRNIINSKYRSPVVINWKLNDLENLKRSSKQFYTMDVDSFVIDMDKRNKLQVTSELFYLTVVDARIKDKQEGYYFKFESLNDKSLILQISNKKKQTIEPFSRSPRKSILSNQQRPSYLYTSISTNTNVNTNIEPQFDVNSIPQSQNKINLQINPEGLCFEVSKNNNQQNFLEKLRKQALKKIDIYHQDNNNTNSIEEESENEESEDNSEGADLNLNSMISHSSSSDSGSNDNQYNSKLQIHDIQKNSSVISYTKNKEVVDDNVYYKVDISHMKYSIYDYEKAMVVEIKDYDKRSQVDIVKNKNMSSKEKIDLIDEKIIQNREINTYDMKTNEISSIDVNILSQKIKYSLQGEDHQPTIIKFRIVSFVFFLVLIFNSAIWISGFFMMFGFLEQNFNYIQSSLYMKYLQIKGVINVRLLTLHEDTRYTNYFYSRSEDRDLILNDSNTIYFTMHKIARNLIFSESHIFSEVNYLYITNTTIRITEIMDHALVTNCYNHSIFTAINQINTGLFHIITEDFKKIPLQNIVYLYIQNSLNEIDFAQWNLIDIYIQEYDIMTKKCQGVLLISFFGFFPFYVICYISMIWVYNLVNNQKETYLTIFFEIRNHIIMDSLEKCEKFAKQIQTDNLNDYINAEVDDNQLSCIFKTHTITNNDNNKNSTNNGNNTSNSLNLSNNSKEGKAFRINYSKEQLIVKIGIGIVILFCFCADILLLCLYIHFEDIITLQIHVYSNQILMQLEYFEIFNSLISYLFDPKQYVNFRPAEDNFNSQIKPFYFKNTTSNKEIGLNSRSQFPFDYAELFEVIYYGNTCLHLNFPPDLDCNTFLYSSAQNGLEIVFSVFFDEILSAKHRQLYLAILQNENNFKYNLTFIGSQYEDDLLPEDKSLHTLYKKYHQIELFNSEFFQILMRTYWFIIKPCFDLLIAQYSKSIFELINASMLMFYGLSFGYGGLVIIFYCVCWIPYERGLNKMIFRTKNMLLIIPVKILVTLHNIQALLGLTSISKGTNSNDK